MPAPELNQNPIGPSVSCDLPPAHSCDLLKRPLVAVEHRLLAAEPLPPEHRHIDILRIDIHAVADSPGALGCDQGAATSQERVVASLPRTRVVENRPAHDLDGLLGAVAGSFVFRCALPAKWVQVRYLPDRRLRAIAAPATGLAFPHCIPAGLMPPVVRAARDGEVLLHPDDLGPDLESAGLQAQRHFGGVNTRMPNVGDGTGKQHPSLRPVDPIVVGDLAALAGPRVETGLLAPLRVEINTIRGIGHHEKREWVGSPQSRGVFAGGRVAAQYSVLRVAFTRAQEPEVAGPGDRGCWSVRNFVLVGEPRGLLLGQLARQFR